MKAIELKRHPVTNIIVPEEWREIEGYDGYYEISNYGRGRTWKKGNQWPGKLDNPKEKTLINKNGYPAISLCKNGKCKSLYAHRLLAEAFMPNPENKPCINHKDADKTNNFIHNLEWCTYGQNNQHAYDNELKPRGENLKKLTRKSVLEIKRAYDSGEYNYQELADKYNVSYGCVYQLMNGYTWNHL